MSANNGLIPVPGSSARPPRSVFKRAVPGATSMNYGRIYPVFVKYQEAHSAILDFDPSTLIRGATPIAPVMGNSNFELHCFSVPWRIMWNYTKQFFGENDTSAWTQQNNYQKPQIKLRVGDLYIVPKAFITSGDTSDLTYPTDTTINPASQGFAATDWDLAVVGELGTSITIGNNTYTDSQGLYLVVNQASSDMYGPNKIADYMGLHPIPKNADVATLKAFYEAYLASNGNFVLSVDALPFRAFFMIVNYYYRDQNYQAPYLFSKDNGDLKLSIVMDESDYSNRLPMPYDFMKYRPSGFFSRRHNNASGEWLEASCFVPPASRSRDVFSTIVPEPIKGETFDLLAVAGLAPVAGYHTLLHHGTEDIRFGDLSDNSTNGLLGTTSKYGGQGFLGVDGNTTFTGSVYVGSSNLFADLSKSAGITLEKFREFVVLSQFGEKSVKGTRYAEFLAEFYGQPINPALLDEPRYLGGTKLPIASWQVTQTAPNSDGSGVGDLGAFTHSKYDSKLFDFQFDEPSILIVCAVARVDHTFAQEVDPHWFRKDKYDEHYVLFDGLGYQPMDKRIPYLPFGVMKDNNSSNTDSPWLGFQESYWEERYQLPVVSGVLNASNPLSLEYYFYNELPTEHPVGGPEYLSAYRDAEIVDKTLQLGPTASLYAQQLLVDFTWRYTEAKEISSRMDPGLTRI